MAFKMFSLRRKLLRALGFMGWNLAIECEAVFVPKLGRTCDKYYLALFIPMDIYVHIAPLGRKTFPDREYQKVGVVELWREVDVVKALIRWIKGESLHPQRALGAVPPKARTWEEACEMTGLTSEELEAKSRAIMAEANRKWQEGLEQRIAKAEGRKILPVKRRPHRRVPRKETEDEWDDAVRPYNW